MSDFQIPFSRAPGEALLKRVEIVGLHGYLSHSMPLFRDPESNISLIYGENGTGKTTILRLIYAALCPNKNEGLRGYIGTVAFESLIIETAGFLVEITRPKATNGPYTYTAISTGQRIRVNVNVDERFRANSSNSPDVDQISGFLTAQNLDILYVAEDREFRSNLVALMSASRRRTEAVRQDHRPPSLLRIALGEAEKNWLDVIGVEAVVHDIFRRQVIEQSVSGQTSTNSIYVQVAKQLASPWPTHEAVSKTPEMLILDLMSLQEKAQPVLQTHALPPLPFLDLAGIVRNANEDRLPELVRILQPFLDSSRARVEALAPIASTIQLLVTSLNQYLSRKTVSFDIRNGITVLAPNGANLPLSALSSGEKHLFFLLCGAYIARQNRCIFLIDEPELSLNVYWQRQLPGTLQDLTVGASVQFLMATHSLEVLTKFSDRIFELRS